jgi:hypothetical protein
MRRASRLRILAPCAVLALVCSGALWGQEPTGAPPFVQEAARRFVASRAGQAQARLEVVTTRQSVDPATGRTRWIVKVADTRSGRVTGVVLDDRGPQFTLDQVPAPERSALRARRTVVDPLLEGTLARPEDRTPVPVLIWLQQPPEGPGARPAPRAPHDELRNAEQAKALAQRLDQRRAAALLPVVQPLLARLRQLGYAPVADGLAPVIAVSLPPAAIREIARWPGVAAVYLDVVNTPDMEVARATQKVSIVHNRAISGTGVKIAMVEVGGRIASNPYLELTQVTDFICPTASSHSTGVAGIINSLHPTVRGMAPGALLWVGGSCSGLSSELQNRANAAADWGARAINLSWGFTSSGTPGINDRFFDDMVINRHLFFAKSSGNRAGSCQGDGKLTSPGLAYNLVTVGGYDDLNTTDWTDDIIDECSSYVNPNSMHDDREKPELVAPSMNINSTTTSGGVGNIGSGTSWSAAMVTATAALLMQRAPALQFWPEAIKAILMATAVHNIEGDRRLSERDGAGAVSADRADDVVRGWRGGWNAQNYVCDDSTPGPTVQATMTLVAGRQTRVAAVWNTDPNYDSYEFQPGADLDLTVLDPSSTVVATSASLDNTYEIVEFVPASSGVYTLRVTAARCDYSPRYLAWAWWRAGS